MPLPSADGRGCSLTFTEESSAGDVIVIDKHPFVLSGEKLKRVLSFSKTIEQEKSLDATDKTVSGNTALEQAKHKPKKHKR